MLVKIILLAKVMAGKKTLEYYQIPNQKILSQTKAEAAFWIPTVWGELVRH